MLLQVVLCGRLVRCWVGWRRRGSGVGRRKVAASSGEKCVAGNGEGNNFDGRFENAPMGYELLNLNFRRKVWSLYSGLSSSTLMSSSHCSKSSAWTSSIPGGRLLLILQRLAGVLCFSMYM